MKKIYFFITILFLSTTVSNAQWETVGIEGISSGEALNVSIDFDNSNIPYIIYSDMGLAQKAVVKKLTGSTWQNIGGTTVSSDNECSETTIAIDEYNNVFIAYGYKNEYDIYSCIIYKYNNNWDVVGGLYYSSSPTIDFIGTTLYALEPDGFDNDYKFSRYDGSWTQLNTFPLSDDIVKGKLVSSQNKLYKNFDGTVKKYNGTDWIDLGSVMSDAQPCVAVSNDGTVYLSAKDNSNNRAKAYIYNSGLDIWEGLGVYISDDPVENVLITVDNTGTPYVMYNETPTYGATCKKYNGTSWELVGTTNFTNSDITFGEFKADGNGTLYFAYSDNISNNNKAVIKKYDTGSSITNNLKNKIKLYPNPTKGKIHLKSFEQSIQYFQINDLTGRILIKKSNVQQNETIDISNLENGIYFVNIKTDKKTFTTKIVKR